MAELFDDISRVIGSRIPRRRALKLVMGLFAGGALGLMRASAVAAEAEGWCYADFKCPNKRTSYLGTFAREYCCSDTYLDYGKSWCSLDFLVNGECSKCSFCYPFCDENHRCPEQMECCTSTFGHNWGTCYKLALEQGCCNYTPVDVGGLSCVERVDRNTCAHCYGGTFFGATHTCGREGVCVGPPCTTDEHCPDRTWTCCKSPWGTIQGTCYRKSTILGCCWGPNYGCMTGIDTNSCTKCFGGQHERTPGYTCSADNKCVPANPTPSRPNP